MTADIAARYRRFAEVEARGASALYEQLALHVACSGPLLRFIAGLPVPRQQPNLFFAAVRFVARTPQNAADLDALVATHGEHIADIMRSRTTQTNEPNRCAVLLPALARLKGPLALLEVGASAGLCLLPDRYAYDFGRTQLRPQDETAAPVFPCSANAATPLPKRLPDIVWRAGLDLHPLRVGSPDDVAWLETLVWPGQEDRAKRLKAAMTIARENPPVVHTGDLAHDLPDLAAQAPRDAQLVVFHSAVLAYVDLDARNNFRRVMEASNAVWISNESPAVFPDIAAQAPPSPRPESFLLAVDGKPVAWTGPHGQWIEWIA